MKEVLSKSGYNGFLLDLPYQCNVNNAKKIDKDKKYGQS